MKSGKNKNKKENSKPEAERLNGQKKERGKI